jgi:tetratricopeptide (TPR) repeat protein
MGKVVPVPRRSKRSEEATPPKETGPLAGPEPEELVRLYLRAQNLEQMHRFDEAIPLYEQALMAHFDAAGPYDRLIAIYRARNAHADVVRVAEAALVNVHTFDDKRGWYESMRSGAEGALAEQPDERGAEF